MEQMSEQNKRLVREITEVIWNGRGLDRIAEFYAPDFVGDYRPYALREGHAGVRVVVEGAWTAFPDYHEEVHGSSPKAIASWSIRPSREPNTANGGPCPPPGSVPSSTRS
jgi:hypothetical protein